MKHSLLILAAAFALIAVSCKKETKPDNGKGSGQKYAVQFDVDDFEQSMGDFGGRIVVDGNTPVAKDSLQKYIRYLYFVVYGEYNNPIKRVIQPASDPNFGSIKDSLPMGRYNLAVLGTLDSVYVYDESTPGSVWHEAFGFGLNSDAFYKNLVINVDGELREKVKLSRIMAKLSINIKDKMPYNATTITMKPQAFPEDPYMYIGHPRFFDMRGGYHHGDRNGVPYYTDYELPIPEELRNTTNNTFNYTILMLDTTKLIVNFSVKDNNGKVLGSKKMLNIPFKPNGKVTLSGNLFDGLVQDSSGASVIVNPNWSDSTGIAF